MIFLRNVCLLFLTACTAATATTDPHVQLAQLWQACPPPAKDAHIQTCVYQGARYEIPVQTESDIVDVDVKRIPQSDTAFERTSPYIVVRGLEPEDRVSVGGLTPGRAGIGDAALMLLGLATRGNPGGAAAAADLPTAHTQSAASAKSHLPFAARTELLTMAPGMTGVLLVHHQHKDHILRIFSEKKTDLLIGASASLDFNILPDRPFGVVTLGERPAPGSPRALVFSQDPMVATAVHALLGLRIRDSALWLGTPIFTTSGGLLSGIELHAGQRRPSFSQALYFGFYGALRWASRPRTDGFTGDDNIEHLPRDWKVTFTFGVELQFDVLTFATGHDTLAAALSSE